MRGWKAEAKEERGPSSHDRVGMANARELDCKGYKKRLGLGHAFHISSLQLIVSPGVGTKKTRARVVEVGALSGSDDDEWDLGTVAHDDQVIPELAAFRNVAHRAYSSLYGVCYAVDGTTSSG